MDPEALPGAVRVRAESLEETITFLESRGFRLEEIAPADDPAQAWMTGHGLRLQLERAHRGETGLVVEPRSTGAQRSPPPASAFVHTRLAETPFHPGRAGLLYRDLLPSRLGGRWIASHIRAATGGPVDDRVHHHRVRLQLIHCLAGEAELVYQEQGPAFVFRPGDLVLQPPGLRHRVLAASAGFEVVEIASPAWHPTLIDHEMTLPSAERAPDRTREGQRFLHAIADRRPSQSLLPGVTSRDLGLHAASGGLARARSLQFDRPGAVELLEGDDLRFLFLTAGAGTIEGSTQAALAVGDAVALPPGKFTLTGSPGLRVFEVSC